MLRSTDILKSQPNNGIYFDQVVLIPLTFNILYGVLFGYLCYVSIGLFSGDLYKVQLSSYIQYVQLNINTHTSLLCRQLGGQFCSMPLLGTIASSSSGSLTQQDSNTETPRQCYQKRAISLEMGIIHTLQTVRGAVRRRLYTTLAISETLSCRCFVYSAGKSFGPVNI